MNNKGFTLVELLVVIALLALSVGFIATNFNAINGTSEQIEAKSIAKGIAEAAYVLIDNEKDNKTSSGSKIIDYYDSSHTTRCYNPKTTLYDIGYLPADQGLLEKCITESKNCLNDYRYKVTKDAGQKKVTVYKSTNCTNGKLFEYGG